jgi:hypothetical protein
MAALLRLIPAEEELLFNIQIIEAFFKAYRISGGYIYKLILDETRKDMWKNPDAYDEDVRKVIRKMEDGDFERFSCLQAMASEDREYFIEKVQQQKIYKAYGGKNTTFLLSTSELLSTIISGMSACSRVLTRRKEGTL